MNYFLRLFQRLPIRYRLLFAYTLAFLTVFSLAGLLIHSVMRTTLEQNIETELRNSTRAILGMVQTAIQASIRNHLRAIAEKNRDIVNDLYLRAAQGLMSQSQARERAKEILLAQSIGKSGYIYCIDHNGIVQVHPKTGQGTDLSQHAFIQVQKSQKTGYIEYDWANPGETAKKPKALYMTYFEPWDWIISASSYREEFRELIQVEDFKQNILALSFGKTGYPFIMDSKGNLVIHPKLGGTNIFNSRDENGRRFIQEVCERKNGKIIYPWKNPDETEPREKLVIFNYIPEMDWIVASSSYLEEFYHPLTKLTLTIGSTLVIMLILLIPITWLISSRLAIPLQEMITVFENGARSGFSTKLHVKWGGEMDEVAKNYNRFVDTLENTRQELEASRDDLEKRVEERTLELSSWIRELEQRNAEDGLLRKMNEMIQVCNTTQEIFRVMSHYFNLFFPGTLGTLYIFEKEFQHLSMVLHWGKTRDGAASFRPEDCWALRQGKPYHTHFGLSQPVCTHQAESSETEASLCVPLMVRDGILGLIHIMVPQGSESGPHPNPVLASKIGLTRVIAEHLSLALVNLRLMETLKRQSIIDPLTGLYNRHFLAETLKREAQAMARDNYAVGVLMIDVDHFKQVNDGFGHDCGDEVLKALGRFLSDSIRGNDLACRFGGEEFVVILLKIGQNKITAKAESLCNSVCHELKIPWKGTVHTITVSVGATLCLPGQSLELALTKADKALYQAKHQGRNQVCWLDTPSIQDAG